MLKFIKEYLKSPSKIGAIAPSSPFLAKCIIQPVDFNHCDCIVEYGPGTGVFTKELIKRKHKNTKLLIIEQNTQFIQKLHTQFQGEPNVYIIHGGAEHVNAYLKTHEIKKVDYIVSGLPFTSLPKKVSKKILHETKAAMKNHGIFITFQYTLLKKGLFEEYFPLLHKLYEFRNLPPAHVLVFKNNITT